MTRTTTADTIRRTALVATALALGAAAYVSPAPAAAQCPWTEGAHARYGLTITDRDVALRTALFTFDDSDRAGPRAALAADPQWARLPGALGLRGRGSRL